MSNNKQSSVKWLDNKLTSLNFDYLINQMGTKEYNERYKAILEQAKAMHKEEIEKAFYQGADDESNEHGIMYLDMNEAETYYNETFGGNK